MKVVVEFKDKEVSKMNISNVKAISNVYEGRTTIGYIDKGIYTEFYVEDNITKKITISDL